MGLSDQPFDITCPDCGAMLKIDPVTRAIIAHTPAPRKRTFEDFTDAARALREADARRDSIFAQSVDAQKNKDDLMAKKFAEAVKKAKETPLTGTAPSATSTWIERPNTDYTDSPRTPIRTRTQMRFKN
jgi:hypothetical protein